VVVDWDMTSASDGGGTDEVERRIVIAGKRAHTGRLMARSQMIDA
jgi:hypothetical protein